MYNEQNKIKYLESGNYEKSTIKNKKLLFEHIASIEEKEGTDICNMKPQTYPEIVLKTSTIKNLTNLQQGYHTLRHYRNFCIENNLIDPIVFYVNLASDVHYKGNSMPTAVLVDIVRKTNEQKGIESLYTPENLIGILDEICEYQYDLNKKKAISLSRVIYNETLKVFYICLYFGIPKEDICFIRYDNMEFSEKNGEIALTIKCREKIYNIEGKAAEVIKYFPNIPAAQVSQHDFSQILSKDYLLAKAEDKTEEDLAARTQSIYHKAMRQLSLYNNANDKNINVKNIISYGITYRMVLVALKYPIPINKNGDIEKLYMNVSGEKAPTYRTLKNIQHDFQVQYEYLKNTAYHDDADTIE